MLQVCRRIIKKTTHLGSLYSSVQSCSTMELATVVSKLNKFAPVSLAGSWDNVGLLVEPSPPHCVKKLFLTNDLTEPVLAEAINEGASMILSYHPPIFVPMKRLTQRSWKERIVVKCVENRIAVFSPHTSYDAVKGGVNDWLVSPFADNTACIESLETVTSPMYPTPGGTRIDLSVAAKESDTFFCKVDQLHGISLTSSVRQDAYDQFRVSYNCTDKGVTALMGLLAEFDGIRQTAELLQLKKPVIAGQGPGRKIKLTKPITLADVVQKMKLHLCLDHVRVAHANGTTDSTVVKSIAVCAGSGSSVLSGVEADVYLSGEMSHHEVLDAVHKRHSVILCDHSNTERGFLKQLKSILAELLENKVDILVSEVDRDPLQIV